MINFDESNIFFNSQLLTNSSLTNLTFAQNTSLRCSLPDILAKPYCQTNQLVRLYDDPQIKEKSYYLVRTVVHITPALKKVLDFIDDCVLRIDAPAHDRSNILQLQ
jgi:DNA-binding transcriptional LysR family regulator